MVKQTRKKKKTKAKGQTRNLRETKFLIKNISFSNKTLPPDIARQITRNYSSNIIASRVHQYNRRNLLIDKLKNYINIITEIQHIYQEENLDDIYYHINNKKILKDLLKEIKKKAKKDVTEKYMDSIEKKLLDYYKEINEVFEAEIERAEYGDSRLLRNLDRFLQTN
jgi:hypothetical protein